MNLQNVPKETISGFLVLWGKITDQPRKVPVNIFKNSARKRINFPVNLLEQVPFDAKKVPV